MGDSLVFRAIDPLHTPSRRILAAALAALVFGPAALAAVPTAEGPGTVRALIDAGAAQLALARIEALQPADPGAAGWTDWEAVRCEVLARLGRSDALLARGASPAAGRTPLPAVCLLESARAAVLQNEPSLARVYAAQLLWQTKPAAAEIQAARLTVIESYVVERRGEEAYRSMLRFQQDYQPLDRAIARRFAEVLLDLGRDREALNWLGAADDATPTRLRLQLRSAGLTPEAVIAQARAGYAKTQDPAYWRVVLEASTRKKNVTAEVEAREHLLQHVAAREHAAVAEAARELLKTYLATASEIGNRERLLAGDDAAWADYAARRVGPDPPLSRAFYAHLAQRAQSADMRRNAQLTLAFSLSQAKLDYTALRVMRELGVPLEKLDAQTRYLLGTIAANRQDPALALELWNGLQVPPNVKPDEWQLTLARTALRAGNVRESAAAVQRLLGGTPQLTPETFRNALDLAQEMTEARQLAEAQSVYEMLARLPDEARSREALTGLGRVHELKTEPAAAAVAYLRAARGTDAMSVQARLSAGMNLVRAEMKEDARAQFEWVLKNTKDPALLESARRGLARL